MTKTCLMCPKEVFGRRIYCDFCKDMRGKYASHRNGARERKIEWLFSFESWRKIWLESKRWHQRGIRSGCFVMARPFDKGPYSPDNVKIVPAAINSSLRGDRWEHLDMCLSGDIRDADRMWQKKYDKKTQDLFEAPK